MVRRQGSQPERVEHDIEMRRPPGGATAFADRAPKSTQDRLLQRGAGAPERTAQKPPPPPSQVRDIPSQGRGAPPASSQADRQFQRPAAPGGQSASTQRRPATSGTGATQREHRARTPPPSQPREVQVDRRAVAQPPSEQREPRGATAPPPPPHQQRKRRAPDAKDPPLPASQPRTAHHGHSAIAPPDPQPRESSRRRERAAGPPPPSQPREPSGQRTHPVSRTHPADATAERASNRPPPSQTVAQATDRTNPRPNPSGGPSQESERPGRESDEALGRGRRTTRAGTPEESTERRFTAEEKGKGKVKPKPKPKPKPTPAPAEEPEPTAKTTKKTSRALREREPTPMADDVLDRPQSPEIDEGAPMEEQGDGEPEQDADPAIIVDEPTRPKPPRPVNYKNPTIADLDSPPEVSAERWAEWNAMGPKCDSCVAMNKDCNPPYGKGKTCWECCCYRHKCMVGGKKVTKHRERGSKGKGKEKTPKKPSDETPGDNNNTGRKPPATSRSRTDASRHGDTTVEVVMPPPPTREEIEDTQFKVAYKEVLKKQQLTNVVRRSGEVCTRLSDAVLANHDAAEGHQTLGSSIDDLCNAFQLLRANHYLLPEDIPMPDPNVLRRGQGNSAAGRGVQGGGRGAAAGRAGGSRSMPPPPDRPPSAAAASSGTRAESSTHRERARDAQRSASRGSGVAGGDGERRRGGNGGPAPAGRGGMREGSAPSARGDTSSRGAPASRGHARGRGGQRPIAPLPMRRVRSDASSQRDIDISAEEAMQLD